MKIETAALHYGAPVRVLVTASPEGATRLPPPKKLPPPRAAWAWAAGIARAALGLDSESPCSHTEIETR